MLQILIKLDKKCLAVFLGILTLLGCSSSSQKTSPENTHAWDQKPLMHVRAFEILPNVICGKIDRQRFMDGVIACLQKNGTVYVHGTELAPKQSQEKKEATFLHIQFQNIGMEEQGPCSSMVHASIKALQQCEVAINQEKMYLDTWSRNTYFEEQPIVEDTTQTALGVFNSFIEQLMKDYQKANPEKSPIFYVGRVPS